MKLIALFLFSWLLFVPEVTTNKTNSDSDNKDILQELETIYGQDVVQLSFFSIEELRPYTILQYESTVAKYSNDWVTPMEYLSLLKDKEKTNLNNRIYNYLEDFEISKKDKIYSKIINYLYTYSMIEKLLMSGDDNYKLKIFKSLRNMATTRNAFENISTLGEFTISSLKSNELNQAKVKSYNNIADLNDKSRLMYYSELFRNLSEEQN